MRFGTPLAPGQRVRRGDALARITSPEVGSAYADVVKAQADRVAADHELTRQQELYAAHAGSRRDLEIAEDNALTYDYASVRPRTPDCLGCRIWKAATAPCWRKMSSGTRQRSDQSLEIQRGC